MIDIRVFGAATAAAFIANKKRRVSSNVSKNLNKASLLLTKEVKESIAGRKSEPKSVDTGQFLNSVNFQVGKDNAVVFSRVPQSVFMEFGTSRGITERRHFRNSLARKKEEIRKTIQADLL